MQDVGKTPCGGKRCMNVLFFADYLTSSQNPHHETLLATVQKLKSDSDRDVRYFVAFQEETLLEEITDSVNLVSFRSFQ